MKIFLCEDDPLFRDHLKTIIEEYLVWNKDSVSIEIATEDPEQLLNAMRSCDSIQNLYFLDISLKTDVSGLQLASKIREYDPIGKIVFVTSHAEHAFLTFSYKTEAMDFIVKSGGTLFQQRICDCIETAYSRFQQNVEKQSEYFSFRDGAQEQRIPLNDIYYFETSGVAHRMTLHLKNGEISFYGSLNRVEEQCPGFFRCHQSYLVNETHIHSIHQKEKMITLTNGETVLLSLRAIRKRNKSKQTSS